MNDRTVPPIHSRVRYLGKADRNIEGEVVRWYSDETGKPVAFELKLDDRPNVIFPISVNDEYEIIETTSV